VDSVYQNLDIARQGLTPMRCSKRPGKCYRGDAPFYRRIGQKVLDTATNFDACLSVTDSQSGFRAFSGRAKGVFHFHQNGFAIESEMLPDAVAAGLCGMIWSSDVLYITSRFQES